MPFPICCTITCYPKHWPTAIASGKNKVSPAQVGPFDLGREGGHLSQAGHLKLKLHFSPCSHTLFIFSSHHLQRRAHLELSMASLWSVALFRLGVRETGFANHVLHQVSKSSQ